MPRTAAKLSAATTSAARAQHRKLCSASAASDSAAALLEMNGSASCGENTSSSASCSSERACSASAVVASADSSAVPIPTNSRMVGSASVLIMSASACTTSQRTPAPPAHSWLSRISSIARTRSSVRAGPAEVAWLRSSAWALAVSGRTSTSRLAPTPVVRP